MSTTLIQVLAKFQTNIVDRITPSTTSVQILSNKALGITMPDGRYGFILNEGQANQEFVIATLSGNTLSDFTRGVSPIDGKTSIPELIKTHKRNSVIKITNHPALTQVLRALGGLDSLDVLNPIRYSSQPDLLLPEELATVGYVLSTITSGNVALGQVIIPGQALDVNAGDWVFFNKTTGIWERTDATDESKFANTLIGVSRGTVDEIVPTPIQGGVLIAGVETNETYVPGQKYYLSDTPGEISDTPGTLNFMVGTGDENENLVLEKSPNATSYNSGVVQEATQTQVDNGTDVGSNGVRLFVPPSKMTATKKIKFTSNGTWVKQANLKSVLVEVWGAGGGGGGGRVNNSIQAASGGGGGAYNFAFLDASDLDSSESVTVGAGGAGGVGDSVGSAGGFSRFSDGSNPPKTVTAFGGGGGGRGVSPRGGGGGGGRSSVGETASSLSILAFGGGPFYHAPTDGHALAGAGARGGGFCAEFGGAGGGGDTGTGGSGLGGSSLFGGAGGGRGGTGSNSISTDGSTGGTRGSYSPGGGAAGGVADSGNDGQNGEPFQGGGGGAGAQNPFNAGNGGNGGTASGGGGGGCTGDSPASGVAGNGGNGGDGLVIITEFY